MHHPQDLEAGAEMPWLRHEDGDTEQPLQGPGGEWNTLGQEDAMRRLQQTTLMQKKPVTV